jgi:uncharacterized protein
VIRGVGVGLRSRHYPHILEASPQVAFFEALSENYLNTRGYAREVLRKIRSGYPVSLHGVSLSLGSVDPLNKDYLRLLKELVDEVDPFLVSDHLCWTGIHGHNTHDLLPLPYTQEALELMLSKVSEVQDFLGRRIAVENPSTYVSFRHSEMREEEFLNELARRSGCGLLIDVNNIVVNACNHGFDSGDYLASLDGDSVVQLHVAGHTEQEDLLIDSHRGPVPDVVWNLFKQSLLRFGDKSTLIEWDTAIPEWKELEHEVRKAEALRKECL